MRADNVFRFVDDVGRLHCSFFTFWGHSRGPGVCLTQAVIQPDRSTSIFLADLRFSPRRVSVSGSEHIVVPTAWHDLSVREPGVPGLVDCDWYYRSGDYSSYDPYGMDFINIIPIEKSVDKWPKIGRVEEDLYGPEAEDLATRIGVASVEDDLDRLPTLRELSANDHFQSSLPFFADEETVVERPSWVNAFGLQHDRDFRFEDEEEKIVFRWEAESRKIFQRRYNWEAEREVTHDTRVFFEPDLGGHPTISEDEYWRRRPYDSYFGNDKTFTARLQTTASPAELMAYLTSPPEATEALKALSVKRLGDMSMPLYYDGFDEDSLFCRWTPFASVTEATTRIYTARLGLVIRLLSWEKISFGAFWVGNRPTIVWDDTGVHLFTDDDLLHRLPGALLGTELRRYNVAHQHHRRTYQSIRGQLRNWEKTEPTAKSRLIREAEWVDTI